MRIVVIEDSPDVASLLGFWLEQEGNDVEIVSERFADVFTEIRWTGVDAAIVDIGLGEGVSGIDVLAWMARYVPRIHRVVFTAYPPEHLADIHADAIVHKPGSRQAILRALDRRGMPLPDLPVDPRGARLLVLALAMAVLASLLLHEHEQRRWVNGIASGGAFAGCLFMAAFMAPWLHARLVVTKLSAIALLLSAALTNLVVVVSAWNDSEVLLRDSAWFVVARTVQWVAVTAFVLAVWIESERGLHWPPRPRVGDLLRRR